MGELIIGKYTYGNLVRRGNANTVTIGKYCSIADGVIFDGGFSHNSKFISTFPFHTLYHGLQSNILVKGNIVLGNDVWIGEGAAIMSGVTIGDGAVVGMRCIVSKDVYPYEVVVGAPQKVLKKRFTEKQIEQLLKIKWWDWDESKIAENALLLQSENINDFINKHA